MRKSKEWKKGVSVVMAALLACGGIQIPAQAKTADSLLLGNDLAVLKDLEPEAKTAEVELSEKDKGQLAKEETVYVIADADGTTQKLIVSDWLKNAMGSQTLEDATELTNITNVKGTENFQPKDGSLGVWDAAGNDIYYQGSIEKELPVDLKISYQLNGRAVSPEELAGQSGKVSIRFDYTNKQKEAVPVGDQEEELYVPFVVMTGLVLDNENFHNIEVANGKVINDGERTIVMGYAVPGLKDNLDIGSEEFDVNELDIPEYVELTADVTDFELAATMTVATNEIFGDMDLDTEEKMDELTEDMDDLQEAMGELMDGTSDLYDGVLELKDGTDELYDGMEELCDGTKELNDGAQRLKDGTSSLKSGAGELVKGINTLADGLAALTANNKDLMDGATQVFHTLLAAANQQLAAAGVTGVSLTIQNYAQVLDGLIKQMSGTGSAGINMQAMAIDAEQLADGQKNNDGNAEQDIQVQEDVKQEEAGQETPEQEAPSQEAPEQEEPVQEEPKQEESAAEQPEQEEAAEEPIEEEAEEQSVQAVVQEKENVLVQTAQAPAAAGQTPGAAQMIAAIKALKASLDSYNKFYQGLQAYTAGVAQANQGAQALLEGAKKLSSGAAELKDGAAELKDGTHDLKEGGQELKDGGQELKDGVEELRDGSKELKDGTVEFNDEGIQKLTDLFEGDIQDLSDRMDAVKQAAQSYQSFSGITDGTEGSVRFIYKTAGIEK